MCFCDPELRTPFCGKPGCNMPHQPKVPAMHRLEIVLRENVRATVVVPNDLSSDEFKAIEKVLLALVCD